ncbi:TRAP transporter small permease [Algibacillus agarilyticus]|uniref:TRAP transporter small permease n=1 Tax=Algibacillus agarilyticus TaxID=2234133 RepID=UPI000DD02588|nr:TRAP transporter small permease [Algibacillus agarilyticus]
MDKVVNIIEFLLKKLLISLCALIVVAVTWQVFSRYILQSPSSITEELARFTLIWISLFGAAYAYQTNAHLGLDVVTNKFTDSAKKGAEMFRHLVVFAFAVLVMVIGGVYLVDLTMVPAQTSAALQIEIGFIYSAVPVTGVIISVFSVNKIKQAFLLTERA